MRNNFNDCLTWLCHLSVCHTKDLTFDFILLRFIQIGFGGLKCLLDWISSKLVVLHGLFEVHITFMLGCYTEIHGSCDDLLGFVHP